MPTHSPVTQAVETGTGRRLLVLGGTGEATRFVTLATDRFGECLQITTSLAGRTRHPAPLPCAVRIGGFGGAAGLAQWISENRIDLVVDATHPFSSIMSENVRSACETTGKARLVLGRAPWTPSDGDRWYPVSDADAASQLVPEVGRRPFLTVGERDLACFAALGSIRVVVRLIDLPDRPLPIQNCTVIRGRGPFTLDAERRLLAQHEIDVVVAKNSGGSATYAKISAARDSKIPVIMIKRPSQTAGERVETPEHAVSWIEKRLR